MLWVVIPYTVVVQVSDFFNNRKKMYPLLSFLMIGEYVIRIVPIVEYLVDMNQLDSLLQLTRSSFLVYCYFSGFIDSHLVYCCPFLQSYCYCSNS